MNDEKAIIINYFDISKKFLFLIESKTILFVL